MICTIFRWCTAQTSLIGILRQWYGSGQMQRIAMSSVPRNISSAMMRSWGNRQDTLVCDEPLYAHYLLKTHTPHPGNFTVFLPSELTDIEKLVQEKGVVQKTPADSRFR